MALNVFYGVMSVYGWIRWYYSPSEGDTIAIRRLSRSGIRIALLVSSAAWLVIYQILVTYTDSTVPALDSFTTAFAITGMILMAERYLEYWGCFILANFFSIPLFMIKELYLTAFLFLVLLICAVIGDRKWREALKGQTPP